MSIVLDAWGNPVTGSGGIYDKTQYLRYRVKSIDWLAMLDLWANAYATDDVVAAVTDSVPRAMFGRGVEIVIDREDGIDIAEAPRVPSIEQALAEEIPRPGHGAYMSMLDAIETAEKWKRLFGGAAVLLGIDDGRPPDEPLDVKKIRSIDWIEVVDPRHARQRTGQPIWDISFSKGTIAVHGTRMLLFRGVEAPHYERIQRMGWGIGDVERVWDYIGAFHATWRGFTHAVTEGPTPIYKIKGLVQAITNKGEEIVQRRMRSVELHRSLINALVLDQDREDFEHSPAHLSGWGEALARSFERISMAVKIPVSILVGISPGGLQSSGDVEIRSWYDRIADERERTPSAAVLKLARLLAQLQSLKTQPLAIRWPSLWRTTQGEQVTIRAQSLAADEAETRLYQEAERAGYLTREEGRDLWRSARNLPGTPNVPRGATGPEVVPGQQLLPTQPPNQQAGLTFTNSPNTHIGTEGGRIEVKAVVLEARTVGENWQSGLPMIKYMFDTPGGVLSWTAEGARDQLTVGAQVQLRARVVAHVDYAGRRITQVQRVTIRPRA